MYTICPYIRDIHIYKRFKLVSNMLTFNVRKYVVSKIKVDYFWILNKHGYQVSYRQNIREVNKTSFALICMISTKVFFFNTPLTESRTLSYQISAIHRISKRVIPIRVLIQISHVLYHTSQLHCLKYRTYCTIPLSYIVSNIARIVPYLSARSEEHTSEL